MILIRLTFARIGFSRRMFSRRFLDDEIFVWYVGHLRTVNLLDIAVSFGILLITYAAADMT